MKTLKIFTFIAICLLAVACGGSDEAAKVAQKIQDGSRLSESDYTVMIDYCGKYAEEAQKIQDKINNLPADSEENEKLSDEMASLTDQRRYLPVFFEKITSCSQEEVGQANVALINKYAPLMWFSSPEWASLGEDVDVAGFVEDMPSADTTSVISTGDGVVVGDSNTK